MNEIDKEKTEEKKQFHIEKNSKMFIFKLFR